MQNPTANRHYDLDIEEQVLNSHTLEATEIVNQGIAQSNSWTACQTSGRKDWRKVIRRKVSTEIRLLDEAQGPGRLIRYAARLNQGILAVSYKFKGRKVRKSEAVRILAQSSRYVEGIAASLEHRFQETERDLQPENRSAFRQALNRVRTLLQQGLIEQKILSEAVELSDEPVERVIYPGGVGPADPGFWSDYIVWVNNRTLQIDAKASRVAKVVWLSEQIIEVLLEQQASKYFVEPLEAIPEAFRPDEVQKGDMAILAGSYMIIATRPESREQHGFVMTNYLKIRNVEELGQVSRRMQNRMPQLQQTVISMFL